MIKEFNTAKLGRWSAEASHNRQDPTPARATADFGQPDFDALKGPPLKGSTSLNTRSLIANSGTATVSHGIAPHVLWGGDRLRLPMQGCVFGEGTIDPKNVQGEGKSRIAVFGPGEHVPAIRTLHRLRPEDASKILALGRMQSKLAAKCLGGFGESCEQLDRSHFRFVDSSRIVANTYGSDSALPKAGNSLGLSTGDVLTLIDAQQNDGSFAISTTYGGRSDLSSESPSRLSLRYQLRIPSERVAACQKGCVAAAASADPTLYGYLQHINEYEITFLDPPADYVVGITIGQLPTVHELTLSLAKTFFVQRVPFKNQSKEWIERVESLLRPLSGGQIRVEDSYQPVKSVGDILSFIESIGFSSETALLWTQFNLNQIGYRMFFEGGQRYIALTKNERDVPIPESLFSAGFDREIYESYRTGVPF